MDGLDSTLARVSPRCERPVRGSKTQWACKNTVHVSSGRAARPGSGRSECPQRWDAHRAARLARDGRSGAPGDATGSPAAVEGPAEQGLRATGHRHASATSEPAEQGVQRWPPSPRRRGCPAGARPRRACRPRLERRSPRGRSKRRDRSLRIRPGEPRRPWRARRLRSRRDRRATTACAPRASRQPERRT